MAPAEGFGLQPRPRLFWPILGHFWCPVVTLLLFSSNNSNFENNLKKSETSHKIPKSAFI